MESLGLNLDFWRGKKVFLTGHTGFKGTWLSLWLQKLGADLIGYALNPPTTPSLFEAAGAKQGMRSVIADIRDSNTLLRVMRESNPEIVIHMAAQPLVRYSYQAPVETYETNVMGTVHLLEAVRQNSTVRAVLNVTSDKCYENKEWPRGYRENDTIGGHDPYSSSKGCAELVTAAYRNSYFDTKQEYAHQVALASVRAGNVIGGGDWATDRLIPDILRAISAHKPVNIRSPDAIRPWQHVLEPLSGYLTLAERLYTEGSAYAESWNFGPAEEDAKTVQSIIESITDLWGEGASWQLDSDPRPHETHHLRLDCTKARSRLGWHPKWRLDRALSRVVAWHKAFQSGVGMQAFTLEQITEYENWQG